jgi:hypothetical protein
MPSAPVSSTSGRIAFQAFFLAGHHDRGDQGAVRPVHLHLLHFAQVGVEVAVGDQLDIVEAEQAAVGAPDGAVARAVDVDDGRALLAERLPDDAAPARLEGALDVVGLVGRRRGGQPERVRGLDADEIVAEISHCSFSPSGDGNDRLRSGRQHAVDRFSGIAAHGDGRDGEVVAAEDAVAAGPDAVERGAAFGSTAMRPDSKRRLPRPLETKVWPIALKI